MSFGLTEGQTMPTRSRQSKYILPNPNSSSLHIGLSLTFFRKVDMIIKSERNVRSRIGIERIDRGGAHRPELVRDDFERLEKSTRQ